MKEDYLSKNYTLEKHLKTLSETDKDYELLYSIWDLNKKNLTNGLNTISNTFPNYSIHDISHSMTIIDNIQCFLGEERIKRLGATDTFLLLMAGLTHDIGMILTYKILEEEWDNKDIIKTIESYSTSNDHIISDAANLILKFKRDNNEEKSLKWAIEIKNATTILTAEIFREKHAKQGALDLTTNAEFRELAEDFYSKQLPHRFIDLLANVAFLHGESFESVTSHLYQKANGLKGDYIHPRFIACMIRLGDLLDFDSNRFNAYSNATVKEMPETSLLHQQKHASVKHMLVSPTAIEAELDCPNEKVYRVARTWFDWLEDEVDAQSREWTNIAPEDLGGLPPVISKNSIKILYNGIKAKPELLNLKFAMSQQKIFSILQGGGIYKEPGFAFIREIVQNAFDASKIQMWLDIKAGFYDSYFEEQGKKVQDIEFPDDIMPSIYKQYPVTLSVKWKDSDRKKLHFECTDYGTGISEEVLLRMTQYVGESHKKDSGYEKLLDSMPYWLKPTAAFGIGLQSVFFVSQTFEVETSYPGETSKRIVFRSAADNQYSSITKEDIEHKRGTTVKVDVSVDNFSELFGSSFGWDILDSVDVFKGEGDNIYLAKIDSFVRKTFMGIDNINFYYDSENAERSFRNNFEISPIEGIREGDFKFSFHYEFGLLVFRIMEKKYGSTFHIWFNDKFERGRSNHSMKLRDVLVENAHFYYWKTDYLGFSWNLHNQATDKIVDISRDNLTHYGRQWVADKLLRELLPDFLNLIGNTFYDEIRKVKNNQIDLNIQYFHFCLTALTCQVKTYNNSALKKIIIPKYIISYNKKDIKASQFFEAQTLYRISGFKTNGLNQIISEEQAAIENKYSKLLQNKILIWGNDYLNSMLRFNYTCTEIIKYEKDFKMYKLEKIEAEGNITSPIECKDNIPYLLSLENIHVHDCTRSSIYGIKKYSNIIVKNNFVSGFEFFPSYSTCSIYSPFSKKEQIDELMVITKDKNEIQIQNIIKDKISQYISPYMIKIIKDNNINIDVTENDIKEGYVSLISDFVKAKRINEEMSSKKDNSK